MAELPEIYNISKQMNLVLSGKKINSLIINQEKCINIQCSDFIERIKNEVIQYVTYKGKWLIIHISNNENIIISLGMGGDILFYSIGKDNNKYQINLCFNDNSGFTIRFWWFGKFYLLSDNDLKSEVFIKKIALDPFDDNFTYDYFRGLFFGRRSKIKTFLLDQSKISGIGNMYIHDILFKSKLHPDTKICDMTENNYILLYQSINVVLQLSLFKGGFFYEYDFIGKKGEYCMDDFVIGYKEGQACPECSNKIIHIKTQNASSYICPSCQKY